MNLLDVILQFEIRNFVIIMLQKLFINLLLIFLFDLLDSLLSLDFTTSSSFLNFLLISLFDSESIELHLSLLVINLLNLGNPLCQLLFVHTIIRGNVKRTI
jgi:hypothetical protein